MFLQERYQTFCQTCHKAFEADSVGDSLALVQAHEKEMAKLVKAGKVNPRTHEELETAHV